MKRIKDNNLFLLLGIGIVFFFSSAIGIYYFYWPLWFKIQEKKMLSDDMTTKAITSEAVSKKGKRAIKYINKWLMSNDIKLIKSACLVLEKMEYDIWKPLLPGLERNLDRDQSELTDAVARVLCNVKPHWEWEKYYKNNSIRLRNLLCYRLKYGKNISFRLEAADMLGRLNDTQASLCLIDSLLNDDDDRVRCGAVKALRINANRKIVNALITTLINDSSKNVKLEAMRILSIINDKRAIKPLIKVVNKEPDHNLQREAIIALEKIGDISAVKAIITVLKDNKGADVKRAAAFFLGRFENEYAIELLITQVD